MEKIIPVSELRAKLSEITKWVESRREPVVLTKNGRGRYVLLDIDTYNRLIQKNKKTKDPQEPPAIEEEPVPAGPAAGFSSRFEPVATPTHEPSIPSTTSQTDQPKRGDGSTINETDNLSQSLREEEDRILRELGFI